MEREIAVTSKGRCLLVSMLVLFASACAGGDRPQVSGPISTATGPSAANYKVGDPYRVNGVWYHPAANSRYDESGIASWYGAKFDGRKTANGEVFDMNTLTAAHKTLPMPTKARVTNLENGRSIIVRINDRGPFVAGRIIDMSKAGALALGFMLQGTARVRVEVIGERGPNETFVAAKAVTPLAEQTISGNAPVLAVSMTPLPGSVGAQLSVNIGDPWSAEVTTLPVWPTNLFVQAGAFIHPDNAERLRQEIAYLGPVQISSVWVDNRQFFRVRIGPLNTVRAADEALDRLLTSGHSQASIVVE